MYLFNFFLPGKGEQWFLFILRREPTLFIHIKSRGANPFFYFSEFLLFTLNPFPLKVQESFTFFAR